MEHASYAPKEYLSLDYLSKWDGDDSFSLAPLSPQQKDSFMELVAVSSNRPMPTELPVEEPVNITHKVHVKSVVVPGSTEDVLAQGFANLGMSREKIENAQQFYTWFSKVEDQMSEMEAEDFMKHVENLKEYQNYCLHIVKDVDDALEALDKLENEYIFVSTKTNALHNACEHLLADQTTLINTADAIKENLEYFLEYDRINNKLTTQTLLVTGEYFQSTLTKIDECIEFMKAHPSYKDSPTYMAKYKQSLSSALGMIKNYVVQSLEKSSQTILLQKDKILLDPGASDTTLFKGDAYTLYYGRFRTNAPKIKALMSQIEKRAEKHEEYQHILEDIYHCYFSQRENLVAPSVTKAMSNLVNVDKQDHCELLRSGCGYMIHLCEDEHQLYGHFFSAQSYKLDEMLLRLCGQLYDVLRPLVIHIYHLETLAELCNILKMDMIDAHVQNNPEQLKAFNTIAHQMLEDVQERLVFRANIYIRDYIKGFKPSAGDLAYPQQLLMMEEIAQNLKKNKSENGDVFTDIELDEVEESEGKSHPTNKFNSSPADLHGMWFPAVRRTLMCLSKLYRCIDKTIFQGLSQEALDACVQSLVQASNMIKMQTKENSEEKKIADGQLFLIKHLLILREQILPFQTEFAIKETQLDFSRTKDAAYRFVVEPRSIPNLLRANSNNSFLKLMYEGAPTVKEYYVDSRKDVNRQLKIISDEFIHFQVRTVIGPLLEFLDKANHLLKMAAEDGGAKTILRQQQFATAEVLREIVSKVYKNLKSGFKKVTAIMTLYLANKEIENVLLKPIKANIQQAFQQFGSIVLEHYTQEDRDMINVPSTDQIGLLLSNVK